MSSTSNIIVLDRDGVINLDSDDYVKNPDEWIPVPGSIDAIARLASAGVSVAVATNQSGLGRGYFDEYALAQMHNKMHELVESAGGSIAAVCYCPHTPEQQCACRKPGTGLLEQIEEQLGQPLTGSVFVGDSLKDIQAARAYHMQPVLVRTGKGSVTEQQLTEQSDSVPVFDSLADVVENYYFNRD